MIWAGLGLVIQLVLFQVMRAPRDIFSLAETVKMDSAQLTEETLSKSLWAGSFLQTPAMRTSGERRELFYFLVLTTIIHKSPDSDSERTRDLLESVRERFFSDSQFYQPDIALADIHNVIKDIFRYKSTS